MKILIVEDDESSAFALRLCLPGGVTHHTSYNGRQGWEEFVRAYEAGEPYDLVFLDIMMPEMNGEETLQHIRAYEDERDVSDEDRVKVVIITVLDNAENVYRAHVEGCDDYIQKPVSRERVQRVVRFYSRQSPVAAAESA